MYSDLKYNLWIHFVQLNSYDGLNFLSGSQSGLISHQLAELNVQVEDFAC